MKKVREKCVKWNSFWKAEKEKVLKKLDITESKQIEDETEKRSKKSLFEEVVRKLDRESEKEEQEV